MKEDYFDTIDNPNKAYWLGFIWCDGYVWMRERKNSKEYGMKIDLSIVDIDHLFKLNKEIDNKTNIKQYESYKSSFGNNKVCRLSTYNKHLVQTLLEKYGIVPHRNDCNKIINNIPSKYYKDFIRGLLDGDGSFCKFKIMTEKYEKYKVFFGGTEDLLLFIEQYLYDNDIIKTKGRKTSKRHKDGDGDFKGLEFCGRKQALRILSFLYDNADMYLNRKYNKYLSMKEGGVCVN